MLINSFSSSSMFFFHKQKKQNKSFKTSHFVFGIFGKQILSFFYSTIWTLRGLFKGGLEWNRFLLFVCFWVPVLSSTFRCSNYIQFKSVVHEVFSSIIRFKCDYGWSVRWNYRVSVVSRFRSTISFSMHLIW